MTALYTISVLCYNRVAMTERCLNSVLRHSPKETKILVTDNGSTDGTAALLARMERQDRRITLLKNTTNLGITGPKSRACMLADSKYFVSLDNDAWVGPAWLDSLRAPMERSHRVMQVGRTGQHQGLLPNGDGYPNAPLEYIDGSCFMTRTAIAQEIGICDPYFPFAYGDDSDYSLRLRARGHEIATVETRVWHPHENDKANHGGVSLTPHLALARARLLRRWNSYLKRRLFDPTIVVRRSGAVGDVITASAVPKRLKSLWPQCRVFFCTEVPEALANNPHIEQVLPSRDFEKLIPKMAYAFDLDLTYERELSRPYWKSYAEATVFSGEESPDHWTPDLYLSQEDERIADELVGKTPPLVVILAGPTTWPGKDINPRVWAEAIVLLRERGYQVAEIGSGPAFLNGQADFNLVGKTSLPVLAAIMKRAKIYLGIDSGPLHIAGAYGIPSIVFFGCTHPHIVAGTHKDIRPIRAPDLDCLGCHHEQGLATFLVACRRGDLACRDLDRVHPDDVTRAVSSWLESQS
jgi:GT2 family glycosyltransferase/ADP-heptose:LPS heptosyltransferase